MKNLTLMLIIILTLYSCGGFSEAGKVLRNEKVTTTDEFLVKKKDPLVLPPDYNKLPEPGSLNENEKKHEKNKIKKILKVDKENKKINSEQSSPIEKIILNEIKRWLIKT